MKAISRVRRWWVVVALQQGAGAGRTPQTNCKSGDEENEQACHYKAFRPIRDAARSAPFFKIVTFCNAPPTSIFRRMPEQPRHSWFLGNLAHCLQ